MLLEDVWASRFADIVREADGQRSAAGEQQSTEQAVVDQQQQINVLLDAMTGQGSVKRRR
jgi:hypothetical protein